MQKMTLSKSTRPRVDSHKKFLTSHAIVAISAINIKQINAINILSTPYKTKHNAKPGLSSYFNWIGVQFFNGLAALVDLDIKVAVYDPACASYSSRGQPSCSGCPRPTLKPDFNCQD
ncbi:hypothetical protein [uncultured Pseudomonas sp.]|uniref:hypothetical protein n=1 Tax=uncultured Pseudomonas sp. TaxID=114707 RepID=UPI002637F61E|nr:hypothetical protein [uncultured Pseudomonas sp.]